MAKMNLERTISVRTFAAYELPIEVRAELGLSPEVNLYITADEARALAAALIAAADEVQRFKAGDRVGWVNQLEVAAVTKYWLTGTVKEVKPAPLLADTVYVTEIDGQNAELDIRHCHLEKLVDGE